ncbi:uncharacterized protein BDR25DRAFT_340117 [Lindgomyces ingoldianus]|uniref:Uncharacterized protein n=1 Tax=Lindgomyces ingoldianus TaxID=673940 RepID=A0ACB6R7M5_9PLEO|nr:uncharacterized protein BDR25DRAFT_340117 [Lindgomyces ingoldianus]KAF2475309.1 hypothetical protein BDR25DRAFT_340117 [Lindgomyces ingoldianus]
MYICYLRNDEDGAQIGLPGIAPGVLLEVSKPVSNHFSQAVSPILFRSSTMSTGAAGVWSTRSAYIEQPQVREQQGALRYRPGELQKDLRTTENCAPPRARSPPAGKPTGSIWHLLSFVVFWLFNAIVRFTSQWPSQKKLKAEEDFVRTIMIAFVVDKQGSKEEVLRYARAKFDTGNPINLISPKFVRSFGIEIDHGEEQVKLTLPGNGKFKSIATLPGRWCAEGSGRTFYFDPRFYNDKFEVSNVDERFDVVIGYETITREGLMTVKPALGLAGFYPKDTKNDPYVQNHERGPSRDEDTEAGREMIVDPPNLQVEGHTRRLGNQRVEEHREHDEEADQDCAEGPKKGSKFDREGVGISEKASDDQESIDNATTVGPLTQRPRLSISSYYLEQQHDSPASTSLSEYSSDTQGSSIFKSARSSETSRSTLLNSNVPEFLRPIEKVEEWLEDTIRSNGSEHHQPAGECNETLKEGRATLPVDKTKRQKKLRKRRFNDEGDEDGGGGQNPSRRRVESPDKGQVTRKLACVFAKHDPLQYIRLRQHLERRHYVPVHCPRCSEEFEDAAELNDHFRQVAVCDIRPTRIWSGINEEKQKALKSMRASRNKSTEENWNEIYRLLFPASPLPDSPWAGEFRMSRAFRALGEFATQIAPPLITNEVKSGLPAELRGQEQHVETFFQAALPAIMRNIFAEAVQNRQDIESGLRRSRRSPSPSMQSTTAMTTDSGYKSRVVSSSAHEENSNSVAAHHIPVSSSSLDQTLKPEGPHQMSDTKILGSEETLSSRENESNLFPRPSTESSAFAELFPASFGTDSIIQPTDQEGEQASAHVMNPGLNLIPQRLGWSPLLLFSENSGEQLDRSNPSWDLFEPLDLSPNSLG